MNAEHEHFHTEHTIIIIYFKINVAMNVYLIFGCQQHGFETLISSLY